MASIKHANTVVGADNPAYENSADEWNADHTTPLTTKGDLLTRDSTVLQRLGVGSDTQVLTADSTQATGIKWAAPAAGSSGGTPAVVLGTAAAAGTATTFLRDDDTIVAFDTTVPVTQAFSDAAATGSAAVAARRDHKHGMPAPSGIPSVSPSTLTTGLQLWVKADQYVGSDGDLVSTWSDQSGNSHNLTAATTARPTYKTNIVNSLPVMRFNGTSNGMRATSVTLTEFFILIVAKVTTMGILYEHSDNTGSSDGSYIYNNTDTITAKRGGALSNANLASGWNTSRGSFEIFEHRFSQGAQVLKRSDFPILGGGGPVSIASTNQPFNVGARGTAGSLFTAADIAEVIVYTTIPNFSNVLGLYQYLTAKYAL